MVSGKVGKASITQGHTEAMKMWAGTYEAPPPGRDQGWFGSNASSARSLPLQTDLRGTKAFKLFHDIVSIHDRVLVWSPLLIGQDIWLKMTSSVQDGCSLIGQLCSACSYQAGRPGGERPAAAAGSEPPPRMGC